MIKPRWSLACAFFILVIFGWPLQASATQGHGGIEGVYAHQIAHLFFIVSMGVLIYWLRDRQLVKTSGWRFIQYSALFFILWNLDAMLVHALDDQFAVVTVERIGTWQIHIDDRFGSRAVQLLYYFAKLDHLLAVPALLCLYLGLKRLLREEEKSTAGEVPS